MMSVPRGQVEYTQQYMNIIDDLSMNSRRLSASECITLLHPKLYPPTSIRLCELHRSRRRQAQRKPAALLYTQQHSQSSILISGPDRAHIPSGTEERDYSKDRGEVADIVAIRLGQSAVQSREPLCVWDNWNVEDTSEPLDDDGE